LSQAGFGLPDEGGHIQFEKEAGGIERRFVAPLGSGI
jgi:hypothetical protein